MSDPLKISGGHSFTVGRIEQLMTNPRPFICQHDQLARQCNVCDLEDDVKELKVNLSIALSAIKSARNYFRWIAEDYSSSDCSCEDMKIEGEGYMEELDKVIESIEKCL